MAIYVETDDLNHILKHTSLLWEEMRGRSIFITGGTGYLGCWLLESFIWANDQLDLRAKATVLSRNPQAFAIKAPHLATHPAIELIQGDVRTFEFPFNKIDFIIQGAVEFNSTLNNNQLSVFKTIVEGTFRTLELARNNETAKFLLISSGAVYGKQPEEMTHISEDYAGAPNPIEKGTTYGESKRMAENLCSIYSQQFGLETKIARGFTFVGPYLPSAGNLAIGDFIRDACRGVPVTVKGDGTPYRSYLYAADMAIWLWTVLFKGKSCRPYNIGSDQNINIADLAKLVCRLTAPDIKYIITKQADPTKPPERYIPSVERAKSELGLDRWISLEEAITKTLSWQKRNNILLNQEK